MEQFFKEYTVYKTQSNLLQLTSVEDPFAKELVDLWISRKLVGDIYVAFKHSSTFIPSSAFVPRVLVGFLLVENREDEKVIRGLWVDGKERGKGVGSYLMKFLLKDSNKNIRVSITDGAQEFYRRFGFKIGERREDFPDQIRAIKEIN